MWSQAWREKHSVIVPEEAGCSQQCGGDDVRSAADAVLEWDVAQGVGVQLKALAQV